MSEETLFHQALGKPAGERPAFLEQACGGDAALRQRLEALLQAHEHPGSFMGRPPLDLPSDPPTAPPADGDEPRQLAEGPGSRVGLYKLLQSIGEGGMGAVYMAEQTEPVQRRVALKLIKPGMDSRQVIARFEVERQALALMDHPNIAKVHDGGTTPAGGPYFVMELVKGIPITKYCDEHRLTVRQRLELLVPVCQAVQHAHTKGVIHRDIKPSNVLVARYDGRPVPKVIDFGIAKATGQRLTDKTLFTEFGAVVGTLEYMSPEQAELNQLDIDTRSDVYSLGVLLYELLTGTTPLERKRVQGSALLEVLRLIREEEPPTPSARLSTTAELPAIAANRGLEPKKLSGLVRGELDWIVMKALDKDRNRRYGSANGLADDLQRYLADEPVLACPPSAGYRLRKIVRRHKGPVLAAALVLITLVAGVVVSTWLAVRATQAEDEALDAASYEKAAREAEAAAREAEAAERKQAEAVAGLLESTFRGLDPKQAPGDLKSQLAWQLDEVAANLEHKYAGQPLVRARLRNTLGITQQGLGNYDRATALFEQALEERRSKLGPDHPDTLESLHNLAAAHFHAGRLDRAVPLAGQALARRRARLGPDHPDTLTSMQNVASIYLQARRLDEALPLFEQALAKLRATLPPGHTATLYCMNNLAMGYLEAGQPGKGLVLLEEALKGRRARLGPDHPLTWHSVSNLAAAYRDTGRPDRAVPLYAGVLERQRIHLGPGHPDTLLSLHNLAVASLEAGQPEKALPLFEQEFEKRRATLGPDNSKTLSSMTNLAAACWKAGQKDKVVPLLEEVLKRRRATLNPDHSDLFHSVRLLAESYQSARRPADAVPLFEEAYRWRQDQSGHDHPDTLKIMQQLAEAYRDARRPADARSLFEEAVELRRAVLGPDHPDTVQTMNSLALVYVAAGRWASALPLLEETLEQRQIRPGVDDPGTLQVMHNLAVVYLRLGERDKALPLLEKALEGRRAKLRPGHPDTLVSLSNLAWLYERQGKFDRAEGLLAELGEAYRRQQPEHPLAARARAEVGRLQLLQQKYAEAEPGLRACLAVYARTLPDDWWHFQAMSLLGGSLRGQKKYAEAEPLLLQGYEGMKKREAKITPQHKARLTEALGRVVQLYDAWGPKDKADAWRKLWQEQQRAAPPPKP
jgi:serine/threonine protein kinase/tetratricopeptide (TPR) repeat protein